jgi:hypothetical protein
MDRAEIESALFRALDALAAIEHERWSHWQRYIHERGKAQPDGSLLIPAGFVQRWEQQMATPYEALSDAEKESDRDQVRRYLPTIIEGLLHNQPP